jgi:3-deoxy-D-manno-octulosonate 8-phosphate phosphatase (KDO 8-P phosphatase)
MGRAMPYAKHIKAKKMKNTNQAKKLDSIKLLLLDVDGVLTDGSIIYNDEGVETKTFNVKDGFGIRLLMDAGINVGIVTGRRSEVLHHRCKNLGINLIFDGIQNKGAALDDIIKKTDMPGHKIAFMGDDLPDLTLFKKVGFSIAPADAHEALCKNADMVTHQKGGKGAVREVCEKILQAKGLWEEILKSFE